MTADGVIHLNRVGPLTRIALGHVPAIAIVLTAGVLLRIVLGFIVAPGQGYATDLGLFASWAQTAVDVGPGGFYQAARSANYPPGYIEVLWVVGATARGIAELTGASAGSVLAFLIKVPAVLADVLIGVLLFRAGRRWFGERRGVLAAALYLFIPVTWYDSALWGQVDAVAALFMLAALVLLIDGWSEPAAVAGVLAVLMKPQGLVVLAVIAPVLLRRHLFRAGSGPTPTPGRRLARLDRTLDGWFTRHHGIDRLVSSGLAALLAAIVVTLPFDLQSLAPASLADLPVIGQLAGLASLLADTANQFDVLTANAYNGWALVGSPSLAITMAGGGLSTSWIPDSTPVLGSISAVTIGAVLLVGTGLIVAVGLLLRDDRTRILLGFTLVAFAFYALPTRVHERYLFPAFVTGALLAASLLPIAWYVLLGLLNTVNLHAVLATSGGAGFGRGGGRGPVAGFGTPGAGAGGVSWIQLPLGDLARTDVVVAAVAVGQSVLFVGLLGAFVWLVIRGSALSPGTIGRSGREWLACAD